MESTVASGISMFLVIEIRREYPASMFPRCYTIISIHVISNVYHGRFGPFVVRKLMLHNLFLALITGSAAASRAS